MQLTPIIRRELTKYQRTQELEELLLAWCHKLLEMHFEVYKFLIRFLGRSNGRAYRTQ